MKALQARGKVVPVVGAGVNDAAALARSELGLSMGTGSDVAGLPLAFAGKADLWVKVGSRLPQRRDARSLGSQVLSLGGRWLRGASAVAV